MAAAAKRRTKPKKKPAASRAKPRITPLKKTGNLKGGDPPHPTGPRNRADIMELAFRMKLVEECLICGKRGNEVLEALANAGRTVPKRTVEDYIKKIRERWVAEDRLHAPATRARQIRELYRTVRLMIDDRAWSPYVRAHQLLAQLEGNYPTETAGPQKGDEEFVGWSATELDRYIESNGREEPLWMRKAREAVHGPVDLEPKLDDHQTAHNPGDVLH